jgi:hypothetical protein
MRRLIVIAFALAALPARAQDTTAVARDVNALRARGVVAEIRSRTTKRNPETGRSTIATIEAYTRGVIADAHGGLVFFLANDDDEGWVRPNAVALLEPADSLVGLLEGEGRDASALRELTDRWFPRLADGGDAALIRAWEENLREQGVPLVLSMFTFERSDAGDVFPSFGVRNISDRTVEGVALEVIGFNQYGDVVRDKSTGMATHYATLTGTIRPGDVALFSYSETALWSNRSTTCIEIRKMVVTFQDGATATVDYQLKEARTSPDTYHVMGECSRAGSGP